MLKSPYAFQRVGYSLPILQMWLEDIHRKRSIYNSSGCKFRGSWCGSGWSSKNPLVSSLDVAQKPPINLRGTKAWEQPRSIKKREMKRKTERGKLPRLSIKNVGKLAPLRQYPQKAWGQCPIALLSPTLPLAHQRQAAQRGLLFFFRNKGCSRSTNDDSFRLGGRGCFLLRGWNISPLPLSTAGTLGTSSCWGIEIDSVKGLVGSISEGIVAFRIGVTHLHNQTHQHDLKIITQLYFFNILFRRHRDVPFAWSSSSSLPPNCQTRNGVRHLYLYHP